ncbi:NAD+ synthase [Halobaculum magnesiiphilum]|uniref:NH(3)-dependent NAD(+) synthetase n=1 Tax=Halobaculum magnesiiphilum TaxID=1017351 RepID=A0A8T8WIA1_9EURY|nr:NAD+ synthase [Halobaculum magnesiiphilum]QZP39454.1 NAD+ synthase [Halobaculum magnesiiphilum]
MAAGCSETAGPTDGSPRTGDPALLRSRSTKLIRETAEAVDASHGVVCLSGGVDSATTAALAVDALGADAVTALIMPTDTTDERHVRDARSYADSLGVDHATVPLEPALDVFKRYVAPRIAADGDAVAAGNLSARLRMACAHLVADASDGVVVGTSNRTERLLGYFTKYGDGAADLHPLGEYDKTAVRALATHLDVPPEIVSRPPTAGFWRGQTDESELGASYATLDTVLGALVDTSPHDPATAIDESTGVDGDTVNRIVDRVERNAHKRSRPPAPSRTVPDAATEPDADSDADRAVHGGSRLAASIVERASELVRSRVEAADAEGVVVDLGTGRESSVAAAIAVEALGADRVRGLHLPCHKAAGRDAPSPESIADDLGISDDRVTIRPLVTELESALPSRVTEHAGATDLGEFVSRVRTACRYYVANVDDRLVVGTTNRTDTLLGRTTRYGDAAADLRPVGATYASELDAVGRQLGCSFAYADRRDRCRSDAVRPDDTRETIGGASPELVDAILVRLVDRDLGIERTADAVDADRELVRRCAATHVASERTRSRPPTTGGRTDPRDVRCYFHELELAFDSSTADP